MKRFATQLVTAALAVALLPGLAIGQRYDNSGVEPDFRGRPPIDVSSPGGETRAALAVTTYASRAAFDAVFPTQTIENFESTLIVGIYTECGAFVYFGMPLDACYTPLDIQAGVGFANDEFDTEGMAVVSPTGDEWLGPNAFGSSMIIVTSPAVAAVGFDIAAVLGNTQDVEVQVTFDDATTHSELLTVPSTEPGMFFGLSNLPALIERIDIFNGHAGNNTPPDSAGELINNFAFVSPLSLPVELTSFDAVVDGSIATLRWETASEENNSGFEVEHRRDREQGEWASVGFVTGHGTTNEPVSYSLVVGDLSPGVHQFRLKQIDYDGAFEYSSLVEATVELPGAYVLEAAYPNPFNPTTNIRFMVASDQMVRVALYNSVGQEVRELYRGVATANDANIVRVDAAGLPSGSYFVQLQGEGFTASEVITLLK